MNLTILNIFVYAVRLAVLAAFTFAFIVLFEHGPRGFPEGVRAEWHRLTSGKNDTPAPPPAPAKSPAGGA